MLRPLATLLSGGGARQLLMLGSLPLLSRLFDPTAFGELGAVMAVVSMTAVIVHGRYHLAVPIARDEHEARTLVALALLLSAVLAFPAAALILLTFGTGRIALGPALAIATILTFLAAFIDIMTFWRSRHRRFAATARYDTARAAGTVGSQVAFAPLGGFGLVLGTLTGALLAAGLAWRTGRDAFERRGPRELFATGKRFAAYPLFGVPQGWLAAASRNLFPLLLLKFAGTALAGQYWLAYRLLLTPVSLVGTAYRQVALPRFASGTREGNRRDCRQHTLALLGLGLAPAALLLSHGDILFSALLGPVWAPAGVIAGWLGLAVLADAFKIPTTVLAQSTDRQRILLAWEAGVAALRYAACLPFLVQGDPQAAIAAFGVAGFGGWTVFVLFELRRRPPFKEGLTA